MTKIQRIIFVKEALMKFTGIWKDRAIMRNTKLRLLEVLIFPVVMYGIETWAIKVEDQR